jgi:hypothetical protein
MLTTTTMRSLTLSDDLWLEYQQALSEFLSTASHPGLEKLYQSINDLLSEHNNIISAGE